MKKKYYFIVIIFLALIGVYLWWAHWYIYHKMGLVGLTLPNQGLNNIIKDNQQANDLVYVALGDSLTAGVGVADYHQAWPTVVAQRLTTANRQIILRNFSFPGYRTVDIINNFLPRTIDAKPDIVTLLVGVNDIHGGVGKTVFKKEYQYILEQLSQKTTAKIYVVSIPYIGANNLIFPPYDAYFKAQTISFNKIIRELAQTYGATYVDIYTPTVKLFEKNGPHYSADSFHPSAEGYELWAQIIYDDINR